MVKRKQGPKKKGEKDTHETHDMTPYREAGYPVNTEEKLGRFLIVLSDRPEDLATYREMFKMLEEDSIFSALSIMERQMLIAMWFENDKFQAWLAEQEDPARMATLEPMLRMLRSNRQRIIEIHKEARARVSHSAGESEVSEFLKEIRKKLAVEGKCKVIEDGGDEKD